MATPQLPVPAGPLLPIISKVPIVQIVLWAAEIVKAASTLVSPMGDIDAKLGFLIGDDTRSIPLANYLPQWLVDIISHRSGATFHPYSSGILSHQEHDAHNNTENFVTMFQMVRNLLWNLNKALDNHPEATTPFYMRAEKENAEQYGDFPTYSYKSIIDEILLDEPRPNLIHMIATLDALLSVATTIPYATFLPKALTKTGLIVPGFTPSWNGSLADVVLGQDEELLTRSQVFKQANISTAP